MSRSYPQIRQQILQKMMDDPRYEQSVEAYRLGGELAKLIPLARAGNVEARRALQRNVEAARRIGCKIADAKDLI
jgi:hypothetical protein